MNYPGIASEFRRRTPQEVRNVSTNLPRDKCHENGAPGSAFPEFPRLRDARSQWHARCGVELSLQRIIFRNDRRMGADNEFCTSLIKQYRNNSLQHFKREIKILIRRQVRNVVVKSLDIFLSRKTEKRCRRLVVIQNNDDKCHYIRIYQRDILQGCTFTKFPL